MIDAMEPDYKADAQAWHRCVETIMTMLGLSCALGAAESAQAVQTWLSRPTPTPGGMLREDVARAFNQWRPKHWRAQVYEAFVAGWEAASTRLQSARSSDEALREAAALLKEVKTTFAPFAVASAKKPLGASVNSALWKIQRVEKLISVALHAAQETADD